MTASLLPWWLSWERIRLQCRRPGFDPWVGKRRAWQPTPVFLPSESPWTEELGGLQSMRSQVPQKTKKITEPENSVIPLVRVAGLEPTAS